MAEAEFDEVELNKILKSKNFSASRLIHKNRLTSEDSERRNSPSSSKPKQSGNRLEIEGSKKQKKINLKTSGVSNSHNIDFYETDLLDIVNSIKY